MKRYSITIPVVKYIKVYVDVLDRKEAIEKADNLLEDLDNEKIDLTNFLEGQLVYAKPIVKRYKEKK